ncbi:MAG: ribose-phosphate diphosphokinase, partial [Steroidobacteraceae bacterium]
RGRHAVVFQSLRGDVQSSTNDRLMRLLLFIGALKDAGATFVTACVPYLSYARKDRRTQPHDPVSTRHIGSLFAAVHTDRVIVLDVHNEAAFDNAFHCETIRLDAASVFVDELAARPAGRNYVVASPDIGGIKRAQHFRELLEHRLERPVGFAFMEKMRSAGVVSGNTWVGDVAGKEVVIYDDLIASGGTLLRAAKAAMGAGAARVQAMAAHAVFTEETMQLFGVGGPDTVTVTDSVELAARFTQCVPERLHVSSIAPLFGRVLHRIQHGEPLGDLSRTG